jgi:microcystin-dependent protein/cytoskeletal protein CcmA (bactofilin family)
MKFTRGIVNALISKSTYGNWQVSNVIGDITCFSRLNISGESIFGSFVDFKASISVSGPSDFNDLNVLSNFFVSGDSTLLGPLTSLSSINVSGDTTLVGGVTMESTLNVSGITSLLGDVNMESALNVSGVTTLMGNVNLESELNISGNVRLESDIEISGSSRLIGPITAISTLNVSGITTLFGPVTAGSQLNVSGVTTLKGAIEAESTLTISGSVTTLSNLNISGNTVIHGDLTVVGKTISSFSVINQYNYINITQSSDLNIPALTINQAAGGTGPILLIQDNEAIVKKFQVDQNGGITINQDKFIIDGPSGSITGGSSLNLSSELNVSGKTTLQGNTTILSNLNISGTTTFNGPVNLSASIDIEGALSADSLNISGNSELNGATTIGSNLNISGTTTIESNLLVKQLMTGLSGLHILGSQTNMSTLNISGSTIIESNLLVRQPITASSSLTVNGAQTNMSTLNISGATIIESNLLVKQPITASSSFTINGIQTNMSTLNVLGSTIMESNLLVKQPITLSSSLTVNGSQTNMSTLNVLGTSIFDSTVSINTRLNIGSTSNTSTLNIRNTNSEIADFRSDNNEAFITVGNYGNLNKAGYISYVSSASQIRIGHRGVTDILYINTSGNTNFGIGNSNPQAVLMIGNGVDDVAASKSTLALTGATTTPSILTKPGLYHRSNVGLGVYSDSSMSFQVNGSSSLSEAMRINTTGNVGIGTTNPSVRLHVSGTTYLEGITQIVNTSGSNYDDNLRLPPSNGGFATIHMGNVAGTNTGTGNGQWSLLRCDAGLDNDFQIRHNGSTVIHMKKNGNIGVGTISPSSIFHVSGNTILQGSTTILSSLNVSGNTILRGSITMDSNLSVNKLFEYGFALIPSGVIVMWTGSIAPSGWALCDGGTYAKLDSSGNITTPDLRGRFVLGLGQGSGLTNRTINQIGGAETHTLTTSEIPSHNHTFNYDVPLVQNINMFGYGAVNMPMNTGGIETKSGTTNNTGSGSAHNNMPPFYVLAYIMKL